MAAARGNYAKGYAGTGPVTTAAFDATGATLLWAVASFYYSTQIPITWSDVGGNTWHELSRYQSSDQQVVIAYAYDKSGSALSVSDSHTVTASFENQYCYPLLFAGVATGTLGTSSVLVGGSGASDNTKTTGAVTGVSVGDLILAAMASSVDGAISVSSGGVSIFDFHTTSVAAQRGAVASTVATSTSDANVTFSGGSGDTPCAIVVFKAAAASAPSSLATLGVG